MMTIITRKTNRTMATSAKYLGVRLRVQVQDLDLADEQGSRWRWVWGWFMQLSVVWGNIQSFAWTEYIQRCNLGVLCQRDWLKMVSPYSHHNQTVGSPLVLF